MFPGQSCALDKSGNLALKHALQVEFIRVHMLVAAIMLQQKPNGLMKLQVPVRYAGVQVRVIARSGSTP